MPCNVHAGNYVYSAYTGPKRRAHNLGRSEGVDTQPHSDAAQSHTAKAKDMANPGSPAPYTGQQSQHVHCLPDCLVKHNILYCIFSRLLCTFGSSSIMHGFQQGL